MNPEELQRLLEEEARRQAAIVAIQLEHSRFKMALESIAVNTCCEKCQEAALVARTALGKSDGNT